jgi:hypothetical protein
MLPCVRQEGVSRCGRVPLSKGCSLYLAWALDENERSSSLSGRFTPERKIPDCYLLISRHGPQMRADTFGEEKNIFPVPGIQRLFLCNPACRPVIIPTAGSCR